MDLNDIYLAVIALVLPRFRLRATRWAVLASGAPGLGLELASIAVRTAQRTKYIRVGPSLEQRGSSVCVIGIFALLCAVIIGQFRQTEQSTKFGKILRLSND